MWRHLGLAAVVGVALAGTGGQPKRQVIDARLDLTPTHPSGSVSRRFLYADVGIEFLRLTLPRDLHAELLILNPIESATGQAPSTMVCVPFRLCRDPGRTALRFCRAFGTHTVCSYGSDDGPAFHAGRFTITVRELEPRAAAVKIRIVFVRGAGG